MDQMQFGRIEYLRKPMLLDEYDECVKEYFLNYDGWLRLSKYSIQSFVNQVFPEGIVLSGYLAETPHYQQRWFFQSKDGKNEYIVRFCYDQKGEEIIAQVAWNRIILSYDVKNLKPIQNVKTFYTNENFVSWDHFSKIQNTCIYMGSFSTNPKEKGSTKVDSISVISIIKLLERASVF